MKKIKWYIFSFIMSNKISDFLPEYLSHKILDNSISSQNFDVQKLKNHTPILGGFIFIIPTLLYSLFYLSNKINLYLVFAFMSGFLDDMMKLKYKKTSKGLSRNFKIILLLIQFILYLNIINPNKGILYITPLNFIKIFINFFIIFTGILCIDGIDGLLGSLSIVTLFFINVKNSSLYIFNQIMIISLISFLSKNKNPAAIFMGDTGSTYLAAVITFLTLQFVSHPLANLIYILTSLSSIIQVISINIFKKKIFLKAPFHHSLEIIGYSENKIVILYNLLHIFLSIIVRKK
jgi:phospho-N-acetylmuramoyl-pentapeptide-transferase